MDEQEKLRGPASYFPAIEQKYGQPIAIGWPCWRLGRSASTWRWWPGSRASTAWGTAMPMPWWPTIWLRADPFGCGGFSGRTTSLGLSHR